MIESLSIKLKPDSPLHKQIKDRVLKYYKASKDKMSSKYPQWDKADELYRAYVKESDDDVKRKADRTNKARQTYTTISIPYSYATLLTAHTYWSSVFLSRSPVFQFTSRHGEGQQKVQCAEAVMDYQLMVGQMLPVQYLWLLDTGKYGMGVVGHYWEEEINTVSRVVERPRTFLGMPVPGKMERVRETQQVKGYVGNRLYNIRPYDFFPDPAVTIGNFQKGTFCGRLVPNVSYEALVRGEAQGWYINVAAARQTLESKERNSGSSQVELAGNENQRILDDIRGTKRSDNFELLEMVVDLIPAEWDLGEENTPQKWVFTLANAEIVVGAAPLGLHHCKFPYDLMTYEVASYEHVGRGMLEVIQPLGYTLDWLFNSHFYNVRKILNDSLIVDPSKLEMKDLRDGGAGRLVRMRPEAYGTDVRTAIFQLQLADVTRTNLADAQIVMEMIQRVTGVTDNIMGMVGMRGRKTATEVRTSSSFGVNRLRTFCEYNSALGFAPLSQKLLQNTQQLYDAEQTFKVAGDLLMGAPKYIPVTPDDIQGFYDFVPVDGTLPIDRFAQANLWKEILIGISTVPMIAAQYDLGGIFSWMAQIAGLKNITQFKIQVQPDAAIAAQAQAGNIVPIRRQPGGGPTPEIAGALSAAQGIE